MSIPAAADEKFLFTPTKAEGSKEDPKPIAVTPLGKVKRTFAMVEAAADGQEATFIVHALRNMNDPEMLAAIRALSADDWERFLVEWRAASRMSVGE